jgi:hypothetical protein
MHKSRGLVRDVFRTRDMRNLVGHMGIAHCRYPTAGSASSEAEAQPFYVNSPFGIIRGVVIVTVIVALTVPLEITREIYGDSILTPYIMVFADFFLGLFGMDTPQAPSVAFVGAVVCAVS